MLRRTNYQYWYSLATMAYAMVVVVGSYWHFCGPVTCSDQNFHESIQSNWIAENYTGKSERVSKDDSRSLQEQKTCIACLLSELHQLNNAPDVRLQAIAVETCCNMSPWLFVIGETHTPISARGPPVLLIA